MEDFEKTIESIPNYAAGQNFEFEPEPRYKIPDFHGINMSNNDVDQKKHVTSLSAPAVAKVRPNAKLSITTATRTSPAKKTNLEDHRSRKPHEYKSSEYSWSTYPSRLHKSFTTAHVERLIENGKPTYQYTKKYTTHLHDRSISSHSPRLTGVSLTKNFVYPDETIKSSTFTPDVSEAEEDTYPSLKTVKYKDHQFTNVFHDYFNDLLVWYNDTLNKNIENFWDPVKGIHENIRIIPEKLAGLTKEVDLMNHYLSSVEVLNTGKLSFYI